MVPWQPFFWPVWPGIQNTDVANGLRTFMQSSGGSNPVRFCTSLQHKMSDQELLADLLPASITEH